MSALAGKTGTLVLKQSITAPDPERMLLTPLRRSLAAFGEPSTNVPGEALQQWRFLR
jgi:hypothetical protein